jgi:uncharacterized protein with GYD domain
VAESRPAALPPAQRTVGQLIAESIRLYGARFWTVLPLGLPFVVVDIVGIGHGVNVQTLLLWAFAPLFCAAYVRASQLVTGGAPSLSALVTAVIVFLPFPILLRIFILPGIAWFGVFGLAVPAAVGEGLGLRAALRRGRALGRVDLVHAVGGIAALGLVYGVSRAFLLVLLHTQGSQTQAVALVLADLVLSPLLFVGAALLYVDQAARTPSPVSDTKIRVGHRRTFDRFHAMPIYILLSRLSQQGVQTLKSNPDRLNEVNRDVEELGAKVLHQWATLGEFDFVNVIDAPDTATVARVSVALAARGSTRVQTLPALTIDDFVATLS